MAYTVDANFASYPGEASIFIWWSNRTIEGIGFKDGNSPKIIIGIVLIAA